jgi:HAMP domain-containing protein
MQGSRLKTRVFLAGLFLVLLVIAAAGWVIRPLSVLATWGGRLVQARS